jgi:hypothetical protein
MANIWRYGDRIGHYTSFIVMKKAIARAVLYVVTEREKVEGGKLSSTATLVQKNQDCNR